MTDAELTKHQIPVCKITTLDGTVVEVSDREVIRAATPILEKIGAWEIEISEQGYCVIKFGEYVSEEGDDLLEAYDHVQRMLDQVARQYGWIE